MRLPCTGAPRDTTHQSRTMADKGWQRVSRALRQRMDHRENESGSFSVHNCESGSRYTVDLDQLSCTCPDFQYRRNRCKHQLWCLVWAQGVPPAEAPVWEPGAPRLELHPDPKACMLCRQSLPRGGKRKADRSVVKHWSCETCSLSCHNRCFQTWSRLCCVRGVEPGCPACMFRPGRGAERPAETASDSA